MQTSGELRRIAVIGAGFAGRDFAIRCVRAGLEVTLEDVMPSRLRSATAMLTAQQPFATEASSGALRLASTVEDAVRDADLAIDFVPDELESKLEIFSMVDRMAPPRTILCTPSSAVSIADLASCTYRPQSCFALRFQAVDVAELIYTSRSSREALSALERWLAVLGFTVTTAQDPAELTASTNNPVDQKFNHP
jgi:3-hydroxybutyryl-CoA dehydrogenase